MKKHMCLLGFFFFLGHQLWAAEKSESEVTLPLDKYLELIETQKTQPITVIEEATLRGDYKTSQFQLTFRGQAVAPWKKEIVLENFQGHLRSCTGSGIVSFENNRYNLLPQKSNFQVTCKLQPKNKNLKLSVLNTLFFESLVVNAESNLNEDDTARRLLTLLEKTKETQQKPRADVVAKANYKLSILPDTSKFEYTFVLNNPNRLSEQYTLNLKNNEIIETISTDLKFQENGVSLNLNIPTGEHRVFIKGKLNGQNFKPILKSEEQYLLIQNHPLMQVKPTTNWRRIATSESAISQDYNSARAFLIDPRESLEWSAKKLEVFSALGFTLKNANYLYYVPRSGKAVVEASYQIANQGTPEIGLKVPGKALYMSVDGQATPLYKDDEGNLLLSINSGSHNVLIQYQPDSPERFLANFTQDTLVKPNAVITESNLTLRHDPAWSLLGGRFGQDFSTSLTFKTILWALFYGALFFYLMKNLYKIDNKKILLSISIPVGLLALLSSFYTFIAFCSLCAFTLWRYRAWLSKKILALKNMEFSYKKAALGLFALFICLYFTSSLIRSLTVYQNIPSGLSGTRYTESAKQSKSMMADQEAYMESDDAAGAPAASLATNVFGKGKALLSGAGRASENNMQESENYEGLPARIDIPNTGKNEYFNISLIDANKDLKIGFFFVKSYLSMIFELLILCALGFSLYQNRKQLKEAFTKSYA